MIVGSWSVIEFWHFGKKIDTIFITSSYGGGEHTILPHANFVPHNKFSWLHVLQCWVSCSCDFKGLCLAKVMKAFYMSKVITH